MIIFLNSCLLVKDAETLYLAKFTKVNVVKSLYKINTIKVKIKQVVKNFFFLMHFLILFLTKQMMDRKVGTFLLCLF